MPLKSYETIFTPDQRYVDLVLIDQESAHPLDVCAHYMAITNLALKGNSPRIVSEAYDRARSVFVYALFDYQLLVVAEIQGFGAFELALKARLGRTEGTMTLGKLVDMARSHGVLPAKLAERDPIQAIVAMRNALAHGTTDVHTPGMAMEVLEICAREIDALYP